MISRIDFRGRYQFRCAAELTQTVLEVSARRLLKGPRRISWNWFMEVTTRMMQRQVDSAFKFTDIEEARQYLDATVVTSPALSAVNIKQVMHEQLMGRWFSCKEAKSPITLLYFHGGGYSFYPQAYTNFLAQLAVTTKLRAFALNYRLTPEHRFPAQLNDALSAYQWLLKNGTQPEHVVIAGDSAGGNLALALLLAIRDGHLPQPALAIAISPPTNFENEILGGEEFDWISRQALLQWRDWFCDSSQRCHPLVSPVKGDLRGLPPIYMQAGDAELLFPSIQVFTEHARRQEADVTLDVWKDMTHNFPVFGPDAPQSVEAMKRIAEVIALRVGSGKNKEPVAC